MSKLSCRLTNQIALNKLCISLLTEVALFGYLICLNVILANLSTTRKTEISTARPTIGQNGIPKQNIYLVKNLEPRRKHLVYWPSKKTLKDLQMLIQENFRT
jgi:hypothetical protein